MLKLLQVRLRFIAILAAVGAVVAFWDTLNSYYEKWTRQPGTEEAVASDVEYFCPMHPEIVRDTSKEKCPICHMDLAPEAGDWRCGCSASRRGESCAVDSLP